MRHRVLAGLALACLTFVSGHAAGRPQAEAPRFLGPPQADPQARLNAAIDPVIEALWSGFDTNEAFSHVQFMSQHWRLPGNPGFDLSLDRIRERLTEAGVSTGIEESPGAGQAWSHSVGTLALVRSGAPDEVVLSRERERLALCINSFSTPADGTVAALVDVGRGDREEDYAGKNIEGAVVLGDADVGQLWRRAVTTRGAAGVISTSLPAYLSVDPPGAQPTPRDRWDILQWSSVPYDAARKAFGFKASPRAAATLRARLKAAAGAPVSVRVTVASTFSTNPVRTLVAEIPGRVAPAERIVLVAHVQEPGANDNASGVATLAELAVALSSAIRQGRIAPPGRTLTFLFLNEISGSRRWLQDHPEDAKSVRYMLSLDMTGEDVAKTGGTFLVERYPDPGAVWERPWDPHTEWGRGNVRADSLKGDLINDAHLAVCRRVARRTGWVVNTNPYEGGSDHTVFGNAGVPSVLDWHFTDRYYHTNFDTPDKTSPAEMRNVGVAAGATAWLFASANQDVAVAVAEAVAAAGRDRVAQEEREGGLLAARDRDPTAARAREATIVAAWKKWYAEAVRSASRLVVGPVTPVFGQVLDALAAPFSAPGTAVGRGWLAPWLPILQIVPGAPPPAAAQADSGLFVCGDDETIPVPIPVRTTAIVLAADGRLYAPCPYPEWDKRPHPEDHREVRERALLADALRFPDARRLVLQSRNQLQSLNDLRWRAAQALARLPSGLGGWAESPASTVTPACNPRALVFGGLANPRRWQPGPLFRLMLDQSSRVRREAAYGIGTHLSEPGQDADLVAAATTEVRACLERETDSGVANLLLEALGAARYGSDDRRADAERLLVEESREDPADRARVRLLGAVKGLEALIRLAPGRPLAPGTTERLRQLAVSTPHALPKDAPNPIPRMATFALAAAGDEDVLTLWRLSTAADWQIRRIVASRLNLADPEMARIGESLRYDQVFQVRYELAGAAARLSARTKRCAPVAAYFDDPEPLVVMRAMDAMNAACTDLDDSVPRLAAWADMLAKPESTIRWHLPSRALGALARVAPDAARERLGAAVAHEVWQVRAAAATASAALDGGAAAVALARDPGANVRTAALDALFRLKHPDVVDASIRALKESEDYQLVRTAARSLRGTPEASRDEATEALLGALRRLTERGDDTSRDPRVAILERLGELMRPERSVDLLPFLLDFDDEVNAAAAKAFQAVAGVPPAVQKPRRRYPYQPTETAIASLVETARPLPERIAIEFEEGTVEVTLRPDVAPVTVARVAELVARGYYDGLTFHRIVPNFVVQGGSPGANEYVGTSRYMRDEVGPQASHVRGAVGISTRGRDTGDAQLFIDLVDLPRLDREYTVFGYIDVEGMAIVDRLLEGAVIKAVTVRR